MSTIPFLAISYTTPLSDDLKNTSFDSYEEATKAWEAFAFQQRFGALVRRLDKDRKEYTGSESYGALYMVQSIADTRTT